jgi:hypothetical protein
MKRTNTHRRQIANVQHCQVYELRKKGFGLVTRYIGLLFLHRVNTLHKSLSLTLSLSLSHTDTHTHTHTHTHTPTPVSTVTSSLVVAKYSLPSFQRWTFSFSCSRIIPLPQPQQLSTNPLTPWCYLCCIKKLNSVAQVSEWTIPTERPLPVGEVSANFCWKRVSSVLRNGSQLQYSRFSKPEPLLFHPNSSSIVLTRLSGPRSRPTTSQKIW